MKVEVQIRLDGHLVGTQALFDGLDEITESDYQDVMRQAQAILYAANLCLMDRLRQAT